MQNSKTRQKRTFPFFFRFFSSCFRFLPHFLMNFPLFRLHEVATLFIAFDSLEILSSRSKLNELVVRKLFDHPLVYLSLKKVHISTCMTFNISKILSNLFIKYSHCSTTSYNLYANFR